MNLARTAKLLYRAVFYLCCGCGTRTHVLFQDRGYEPPLVPAPVEPAILLANQNLVFKLCNNSSDISGIIYATVLRALEYHIKSF